MTTLKKPPIDAFWVTQRGRIYARDLEGAPPAIAPEPAIAVRLQEATRADAEALAVAMNQAQPGILDRFRQQRRCFVAWHGDAIAAYCWISVQQEYVGEMETVLDIRPGEAYIWNCATLPHYRRQGLYTALLAMIINQLTGAAFERIWIGADLENVPSHRAFASAGFLPAADFRFFRVWRLYGFFTRALAQTPPHLLQAARRLFQINHLLPLGPLSLGWRHD